MIDGLVIRFTLCAGLGGKRHQDRCRTVGRQIAADVRPVQRAIVYRIIRHQTGRGETQELGIVSILHRNRNQIRVAGVRDVDAILHLVVDQGRSVRRRDQSLRHGHMRTGRLHFKSSRHPLYLRVRNGLRLHDDVSFPGRHRDRVFIGIPSSAVGRSIRVGAHDVGTAVNIGQWIRNGAGAKFVIQIGRFTAFRPADTGLDDQLPVNGGRIK